MRQDDDGGTRDRHGDATPSHPKLAGLVLMVAVVVLLVAVAYLSI